jgi:hypothetical protein
MLWLLLACSTTPPAESPAPTVDCSRAPSVTWENWGHGFFLTYCTSCHSAATPEQIGRAHV